MAESTAYSCPQCRATLALDPATGQLACEYCGGSFTVQEIEELVNKSVQRKKALEQAAEAAGAAGAEGVAGAAAGVAGVADAAAAAGVAAAGATLPGDLAGQGAGAAGTPDDAAAAGVDEAQAQPAERSVEEWQRLIDAGQAEQFTDVVGYTCPNCGAQVVSDSSTVATSCQYCGSSVVVDARLTGGLKPSLVIPFAFKPDILPKKLTEFYKNRPLLPKNFFYNNQVGEVQGLYVPFWLYSGSVDGDATFSSSQSTSYTDGRDEVTETTYYTSVRQGSVSFSQIPVDASERIDDDLMDSIEPFRYKDLKPFSPAYLTGFVAERFDQGPAQVLERCKGRMISTTEDMFAASVPGGATLSGGSFDARNMTASYAMLPVYLFNCKYDGKLYRYAVNGQTGKIVGEVPCGKRESLMAFVKPALIAGIGASVVLAGLFSFLLN